MQVKKSHWERPDQEGSIDNKETNTPDIQHRNWTQTCGSYETSYVIKILFLAIILVSKCWGLAEEGKGHFRHRQKGRGRTNRSFTDTDKQILGGHCLPAKLLPFFVSLYTHTRNRAKHITSVPRTNLYHAFLQRLPETDYSLFSCSQLLWFQCFNECFIKSAQCLEILL